MNCPSELSSRLVYNILSSRFYLNFFLSFTHPSNSVFSLSFISIIILFEVSISPRWLATPGSTSNGH